METAQDILAGYVDRAAIAKAFDVSERTIMRYENEPDGLPNVLLGGRKLYPVAKAKQWVERRVKSANPRHKPRRAA